jgi:hypothetical protein
MKYSLSLGRRGKTGRSRLWHAPAASATQQTHDQVQLLPPILELGLPFLGSVFEIYWSVDCGPPLRETATGLPASQEHVHQQHASR